MMQMLLQAGSFFKKHLRQKMRTHQRPSRSTDSDSTADFRQRVSFRLSGVSGHESGFWNARSRSDEGVVGYEYIADQRNDHSRSHAVGRFENPPHNRREDSSTDDGHHDQRPADLGIRPQPLES